MSATSTPTRTNPMPAPTHPARPLLHTHGHLSTHAHTHTRTHARTWLANCTGICVPANAIGTIARAGMNACAHTHGTCGRRHNPTVNGEKRRLFVDNSGDASDLAAMPRLSLGFADGPSSTCVHDGSFSMVLRHMPRGGGGGWLHAVCPHAKVQSDCEWRDKASVRR